MLNSVGVTLLLGHKVIDNTTEWLSGLQLERKRRHLTKVRRRKQDPVCWSLELLSNAQITMGWNVFNIRNINYFYKNHISIIINTRFCWNIKDRITFLFMQPYLNQARSYTQVM